MNSAYAGATRGRQQGIALVRQNRQQRLAEEAALREQQRQADEAKMARERFAAEQRRKTAEDQRANEHLGIAKQQEKRAERGEKENRTRWEADQKTGVEKTAEDKRRWDAEQKTAAEKAHEETHRWDAEEQRRKSKAAREDEEAARRKAARESPGHDLIKGIITGDDTWRTRHTEFTNAEVQPDNSIVLTGKDGKKSKVASQTVLYHMDLEGYQPSAAGINAGIKFNTPSRAEVAQQGVEALQEMNEYFSFEKVPAMKLKGIQHDLVAGMPFDEAARKWKLKPADPERASKAEELAAKKQQRASLQSGEGISLNRSKKIRRLTTEIAALETELKDSDPVGVRYSGLATEDEGSGVGPQSPAGQGIAPPPPVAPPPTVGPVPAPSAPVAPVAPSPGMAPAAVAPPTSAAVAKHITLPPYSESQFQAWYADWSRKAGIDANPDNPLHKYDYRAAFAAGEQPAVAPEDGKLHWPSQFKDDDHPNRYVGGQDTKTGKPVLDPNAIRGDMKPTAPGAGIRQTKVPTPVQPPPVAPGVQRAQARMGSIGDVNQDGKVDDLDRRYAFARKVMDVIKANPAAKNTLSNKYGPMAVAEMEAIVKAVEKNIRARAGQHVQNTIGQPTQE